MNAWQILGIEPTADESAIKKAYAKQLKHNKPDKNPEGFKALRQAYEHALATRYYYADDENDDDYDENDENDDVLDKQTDHDNSDETDVIGQPDDANDVNHANDNLAKFIKDVENIPPAQGMTIHYQIGDDTKLTPNESDDGHVGVDKDDFQPTNDPNNHTDHHADNQDDQTSDWTDDDASDESDDNDYESLTNAWYDIDNAETSHQHKDNALLALLGEQAQQLPNLSLDDRMEYEQDLLHFFMWRESIYHQSYHWVFDNFGWQDIMNTWQIERYPWHYLTDLQERYKRTVVKFISYGNDVADELQAFEKLLQNEYPTFYEYYQNSHPNTYVHAYRFIKRSFYPEKVGALSYDLHRITHALNELSTLDQKGDYLFYTTLHGSKTLKELKEWTFDGVFSTKDVLMTGAIIWYLVWGTSLALDKMTIVNHHVLPVLIFVGMMMIFWRWRWQLFVTPNKFNYQRYLHRVNERYFKNLHISIPLIFASGFYGAYHRLQKSPVMTDETAKLYDDPSYFVVHGLAFGLWWSLMRVNRYENPFAVQAHWYVGFIFTLVSVVYPLIALLVGESIRGNILGYHPLLWLIIYTPIVLHLIAVNGWSWLHSLENMVFRVFFGLATGLTFMAGLVGFGLAFNLPLFGALVIIGLWLAFKSLTMDDDTAKSD